MERAFLGFPCLSVRLIVDENQNLHSHWSFHYVYNIEESSQKLNVYVIVWPFRIHFIQLGELSCHYYSVPGYLNTVLVKSDTLDKIS